MTVTSSPRSDALRAIATRVLTAPDVPAMAQNPVPTSSYFGINVKNWTPCFPRRPALRWALSFLSLDLRPISSLRCSQTAARHA